MRVRLPLLPPRRPWTCKSMREFDSRTLRQRGNVMLFDNRIAREWPYSPTGSGNRFKTCEFSVRLRVGPLNGGLAESGKALASKAMMRASVRGFKSYILRHSFQYSSVGRAVGC